RVAYEYLPEAMVAGAGPGVGGVRDPLEIRPDPVRWRAEIGFVLPHAGRLRVAIYDLGGRRVRTLRAGEAAADGEQRLALDARGDDGRTLQTGVYFVRVQGPDGARSRRFVVLR